MAGIGGWDGDDGRGGAAMELTRGFAGRQQALVDLFAATFADSEGAAEGVLIGAFVRDLLARTPPADLQVFRAEEEGGRLIGAAIFTPLVFAGEAPRVALLSPVAVATARQGRGVGQTLLHHALAALRREGVGVAVTYGDPEYYRRVGFLPMTEAQVPPPLPLSRPEGWLGQSLEGGGGPAPALRGPSRCVAALNRADLW